MTLRANDMTEKLVDDIDHSGERGRVLSYGGEGIDTHGPDGAAGGDSGPHSVLEWTDVHGRSYTYHPNPMVYSCPFILAQEACERLAYYGVMPTLLPFLQQFLHMGGAEASSYINVFQGTMFLTPIPSAILSDTFFGPYKTIIIFSVVYMAGLILLALSAVNQNLSWLAHVGIMGLLTCGAGGIKSQVNVFGAQQFHPVVHAAAMTSFFTYFYASINVGAIIGGFACPTIAENVSYFVAYLIPVCSFGIAIAVFVMGTKRYVRILPTGSPVLQFVRIVWYSGRRRFTFALAKSTNGGPYDDAYVDGTVQLCRTFPVLCLVVPLMIAYNQMTTAFLTQGQKMRHVVFGFSFPPSLMQSADSLSVIIVSALLERLVYPSLRRRDRMPTLVDRYLIGNLLGACALVAAYIVELVVMESDVGTLSIFWQVPQFALIAAAECFSVSTSYEAAFTYAPSILKSVASGGNLLYFALAGYLSAGLFKVCSAWLPDFVATDPTSYNGSGRCHYDYYYLVLTGVCIGGVFLSLAFQPYVKRLKTAAELALESSQGRQLATEETALKELSATAPTRRTHA